MDEEGLFSDKNKLSPEIFEAKAWFESHADGLQLQLKAVSSDEITLLTPDWKKSFSYSDENCKVVEINLISENDAHFSSTEYDNAYNRMKAQGYSDNDAQSYALTYALRNTGMKVYEMNTNGEFKEQKTELSGNNYITLNPQKNLW
jgi:hypothetical protein